MIYSSKTPREIKDHWPDWRERPLSAHYPQHNTPNPILVAFRADVYGPDADMVNTYMDTVDWWLAYGLDHYSTATDDQTNHARRVLTRLANLSTETETIS